jgi:hypothetical protein
MATTIDPSELDPKARRELGKQLGIRVLTGEPRFTADEVASHAQQPGQCPACQEGPGGGR